MNVLIVGGSGLIGHHTAAALLGAGHRVTALQRGEGTGLPAGVQRLRGQRDELMPTLANSGFEACVDICGYFPAAVRRSCAALAGVRRYVYISAARVYGDPAAGPVTEDFPRVPAAAGGLLAIDDVEAIDDASYGPLKVACEDVVTAAFGARATLLRPQVVVGPGDVSGHLAHWVDHRQNRPESAFPGDGSDWMQVIDVRDVASFIATVLEHDLAGPYNLAGPRMRWHEFVAALGLLQPRWASVDQPHWRSTPLYRPPGTPYAALMDVCNARARAAGFTPRSAANTVRTAASAVAAHRG